MKKSANQYSIIINQLNSKLEKKQDASTAITTSNIGKQSVNNSTYAQNATGNLRNELNNKWTKSPATAGEAIPTSVNFGYDTNVNVFFIDFIFADGTIDRLNYDTSYIRHQYFNGSTWTTYWGK